MGEAARRLIAVMDARLKRKASERLNNGSEEITDALSSGAEGREAGHNVPPHRLPSARPAAREADNDNRRVHLVCHHCAFETDQGE